MPQRNFRHIRGTGLGSIFCPGDALFHLVQCPQMPEAKVLGGGGGMLACPQVLPPEEGKSQREGGLSKMRICPMAQYK